MVTPGRRRTLLGAIVSVGLLIGATALSVSWFTDLRTLMHVLTTGQWPWIAAAVAMHVIYFASYAVLYRLGFAVVGVSSGTWRLVPLVFAGLFVNLMVPTGAGAAAVFVDDAIRRGENGARATVGVVLVLLLDLVTVLPFVVWGIAFLVREDMFASWQVLAAAAFAAYTLVLVALLAVSRARQQRVCGLLHWGCRVIARPLGWMRVHGPREDWPTRTAAGFADAAAAIAAKPGQLVLAGLSAVWIHLVHAIGLWLLVRGFGADVPLGALVASFSLGLVLVVIAVVPSLTPVAQAFMTATFIGVGVAPGPAVAAPLAFRGITIGLPLLIGLPFAWRIGQRRRRAAECRPRHHLRHHADVAVRIPHS